MQRKAGNMKRIIEKSCDGLCVKAYLANYLPDLSRRILIDLKKRPNGITVNGARVSVRYLLHEGDVLSLALEDEASSEIPASSVLPEIIYEDDDIICVNKASGMPTHPSHGHYEDSLASSLAYYYQLQNRPFVFRVINRLDGVTSGVVLIAKNHLSAARLSASLTQCRFQKHYTALLEGKLEGSIGLLDQNIKRRLPSIIERTVCSREEGERALTTYRVLGHFGNRTLVDAFPHTGRTHQLRVHFSSIGHPIVGDFLYGTEEEALKGCIALHCASMSFPHPSSNCQMKIEAPLPGHFHMLINHTGEPT